MNDKLTISLVFRAWARLVKGAVEEEAEQVKAAEAEKTGDTKPAPARKFTMKRNLSVPAMEALKQVMSPRLIWALCMLGDGGEGTCGSREEHNGVYEEHACIHGRAAAVHLCESTVSKSPKDRMQSNPKHMMQRRVDNRLRYRTIGRQTVSLYLVCRREQFESLGLSLRVVVSTFTTLHRESLQYGRRTVSH